LEKPGALRQRGFAAAAAAISMPWRLSSAKSSKAGHLIFRASFRRLLALPSATSIVAEIKAQIGAYVLVLYRANSGAARMYSIGVARKFRRRGLAGLLLTAAEKDAVRRGRKAMRLEVRADDRGTIALYESSGYRRVGRAPGYYGGRVDALRLEKALGKEPRRHL
jgi:ribosomal protein S18 acetylase RimI-like enzyme